MEFYSRAQALTDFLSTYHGSQLSQRITADEHVFMRDFMAAHANLSYQKFSTQLNRTFVEKSSEFPHYTTMMEILDSANTKWQANRIDRPLRVPKVCGGCKTTFTRVPANARRSTLESHGMYAAGWTFECACPLKSSFFEREYTSTQIQKQAGL